MNLYLNEKKNIIIEPILNNLSRLGWKIYKSDLYDPAVTFRNGFYQVILENELKKAINRINPWLEEDQVIEVMRRVMFPKERGLIIINREIFSLIEEGVKVSENRKSKEKDVLAYIIDFSDERNNSFIAIPLYKVQVLGTGKHFLCDIVLFVNGIPCIVIEGELPCLTNPILRAFDRIKKFSNLDGSREGNEWLFYYNQFVVLTDGKKAKYGTIFDHIMGYREWKISQNEKSDGMIKENVSTELEVLLDEMLRPSALINIIRNFILFDKGANNKLEKSIVRYYQYNAANKMIQRIKTGTDAKQRGGIVYITYGAGKSMAIIFSLLRFYNEIGLEKWKTLLVIEKEWILNIVEQISKLKRINLIKVQNVDMLKESLKEEGRDIIVVLMHKINEKDLLQEFPVLNESDNILIMIDQQHRASYKWLSANLQKGSPNAIKIVFTGSPLDVVIESNYNPYIEKYSYKEAIADGNIVEILHETRIELVEDIGLQETEKSYKEFKDVYGGWTEEETRKGIDKSSKRAYLESLEVIREKAREILKHYLMCAFPNKFKAQLVTYSHLAAVRYKQELDKAIQEAVELFNKNPYIDINRLKKLKVAALITKSVTDPPAYRPFTDETEHRKNIKSFLLPFETEVNGVSGDVGIIIVTDLFISGFHAPLEQVIYIDQIMKDHLLLQAISRINCPEKFKTYGVIVDYVGFTLHKKEALSGIPEKDQENIIQSWKNSISNVDYLKWSDKNIRDYFKERGILYLEDIEACMNVLAENEDRSYFYDLYKNLAKYMDRVLPKPEAFDYADLFKILTLIAYNARLRYSDFYLIIDDLSPKLKIFLNDLIEAKKIDLSEKPPDIFSNNFREMLNASKHFKSKAKQLECAINEYINVHCVEDPEFYERLVYKINKVKTENQENYELLYKEYLDIIESIKKGRINEENYGLDPYNEKPYFSLLMKEIFGVYDQSLLNEEQINFLLTLSKKIIDAIKKETQSVAFWHNIGAQKKLKAILLGLLLTISVKRIKAKKSNNAIAQQLIELACYIQNK